MHNKGFRDRLRTFLKRPPRKSRRELERCLFELDSAYRIAKEAYVVSDLEDCLNLLIDRVSDLMSVEIASIMLMDNESDDSVNQSDGFVDDIFPPLDATTLKLFYWDGYSWRYVGGVVNTENHTVTAEISHFSMYALFAARGFESKDFRPYERIITPNGDGIND